MITDSSLYKRDSTNLIERIGEVKVSKMNESKLIYVLIELVSKKTSGIFVSVPWMFLDVLRY